MAHQIVEILITLSDLKCYATDIAIARRIVPLR